jgi:hypothetical protein
MFDREVVMRPLKAVMLVLLSLVLISAFAGIAQAQVAKSGKPRGVATFYGIGKVQEFAPDVAVWTGTFPGESVSDAGQGVLHFGAWDCTGEVVYRGGKISYGGGFCAVADKDGDKINVRWQVDEPNANPGKFKTKGTYLSGSGKYSGIQGEYNFICEAIGTTSHFICPIVGGEYRLP